MPLLGDANLPARGPVRPGTLDPYLKNEGIKRCPSMPAQWQLSYALNYWSSAWPSDYYSVNPSAKGNEYGPASKTYEQDSSIGYVRFQGASDAEVEEPSYTLVVWEHEAYLPPCAFLQRPNWLQSPPNDSDLRNHFHFLHRDAAVGLWADGHVKRIQYNQLRRSMFTCRKDLYPKEPQ